MLKFRVESKVLPKLADVRDYSTFEANLLARKQYLADPGLLPKLGLSRPQQAATTLSADELTPIRPRSQFLNEFGEPFQRRRPKRVQSRIADESAADSETSAGAQNGSAVAPQQSTSDNINEAAAAMPSTRSLRQLCLERLSGMPYGYLILRELALVAGSLGELTAGHLRRLQLHHIRGASAEPLVAVAPPQESIPFIDEAPAVPPRQHSPAPPPVPELPQVHSFLGFPTHRSPTPPQRQPHHHHHRLIADDDVVSSTATEVGAAASANNNGAGGDDGDDDDQSNRLLAIIRGTNDGEEAVDQSASVTATGRITDIVIQQQKHQQQQQQQQPSHNRANAEKLVLTTLPPPANTNTMSAPMSKCDKDAVDAAAKVHVITVQTSNGQGDINGGGVNAKQAPANPPPPSSPPSFSASSTSSKSEFRSSTSSSSTSSSIIQQNGATIVAPPVVKQSSSSESSTYQSKKRIENGQVVFEFADASTEKSATNSGDGDTQRRAPPTMKSHSNLDHNKTTASQNTMPHQQQQQKQPQAVRTEANATASSSTHAKNTPITTAPAKTTPLTTTPTVATPPSLASRETMQQQQQQTNKHVEHFDHERHRIGGHSDLGATFDAISELLWPAAAVPSPPTLSPNSTATVTTRSTPPAKSPRTSATTSPSSSVVHTVPITLIDGDGEANADSLPAAENVVKPLAKEEGLCKGIPSNVNVRAPRMTENAFEMANKRHSDHIAHLHQQQHNFRKSIGNLHAPLIPMGLPEPPTRSPRRRMSLPKEIHDQQLEYIRQKERELHDEFEQLERDRVNLLREIEQMQVNQSFQDFVAAHKEQLRRRTAALASEAFPIVGVASSEAELLRKRMHDEWLHKVAEREERRIQKVIKITRPGEANDAGAAAAAPKLSAPSTTAAGLYARNLGSEFLDKVQERRTKLRMASDSDWESGAESQPEPRNATATAAAAPVTVDPSVKVLQGGKGEGAGAVTTDASQLPAHLKEFVSEFTREQGADGSVTSTQKVTEFQKRESSSYVSSSSMSESKSSSAATSTVQQPPKGDGIWSPSTTPTPVRKNQPADQQQPPPQQQQSTPTASSRSGAKSPAPTPPPPPTFWAPSPSPTADRREFRPVKFESPAPVRKVYTAQADSAATVSTTAATPPWTQQQQSSERLTNAQSAPFRVADTNNKTKPQQAAAATSAPHHKVSFADATAPQPSAVQQTGRSGTTSSTSVQESHHSSSSCFSQQQSKFERHHQISSSSSGGSNNQQTQSSAAIRSNEVVHPIQYIERVNEAQPSATTAAAAATLPTISMKQTTAEAAQTSSAVPARKSSDIGPTTKDGMPIVLRSEVDEDLHHKWYKRMYNTLHKVHQDDDSVTVRYKTRRGRYPYKSNGYLSEPEPHYDSDYATKYSTLDRRRLAIAGEQPHSPPTTTTTTYAAGRHHQMYNDDKYYGTLPNPVKSTAGVYKNQPGKIENFLPGQSSVSEKERKDWWDQVMEIFDGRLEQERSVPRAYHEGYLSKALKDQGYESDSTLVFRKKELQQIGQLSGEQQKQAYLNLQAGGEVPVHGFRKLAPEKPKEFGDAIEYIPITQTLTKLRVRPQRCTTPPQQQPQQQREILCYPIANVSRPIDMFGAFPSERQHFVPVSPPPPPCRKSSRRSTTLRIFTGMHAANVAPVARATRKTPPPVNRSKSSGCVYATTSGDYHTTSTSTATTTTTTTLKEAKNQTNHSRVTRKQCTHRVTSVSPVDRRRRSAIAGEGTVRKSSASPIAFGRSISKERTFAEEKKRLEQSNPLCRRAPFAASTSILRNPDLKSPDEVKRAIKTTFQMPGVQVVSAAGARDIVRVGAVRSGRKVTAERCTQSAASHSTATLNRFDRGANRSVSVTMTSRRDNAITSRTASPANASQTLIKSSSNVSLARTSSTFSIDSNSSSRRKSGNGRRSPQTISSINQREKHANIVIVNGKQRRKKCASKEKLNVSTSSTTAKSNRAQQLHDSINAEIHSKNRQHRSTAFFQKLFLKDMTVAPSPPPVVVGAVQHRVNVWDKILEPPKVVAPQQTVRPQQWSNFLIDRRPVTESRFHQDEFEQRLRQSRSLSPQRRRRPPQDHTYVHLTTRFVEQKQFGHRSRSGPAAPSVGQLCLTEVVQPNEPLVIHGRTAAAATRPIRSPSCRRIHSHRSITVGAPAPKVRARSAGVSKDEDERRFNSLDSALSTSRSIGTLNVSEPGRCYENHSPRCVHRSNSRPSERFRDLNRFYADLERVAQLEKATSATDVRPIRRRGEVIDFEEWRKLRLHERAERELNVLRGRIKQDEREKNFLFRAKYPENNKWSVQTDSGLRCKEKSVEDLKDILREKTWQVRSGAVAETDKYKSLWRGNSVLDVASTMVSKYGAEERPAPATLPLKRSPASRGLGISAHLMGALSDDQVSRIETQLKEIYNDPATTSSANDSKYFVQVSGDKQTESHAGLTVRCNSAISKEDLLGPMLLRHQARVAENMKSASVPKAPPAATTTARVSRSVDRYEHIIREEQRALSESEKRSILHNLSKEISEKVSQRQRHDSCHADVLVPKETRGAVASHKANTASKPKALPIIDSVHFLGQSSEASVSQPVDKSTSEDHPVKEQRTVDDTIEYFERKMEEPPPEPTVYRACEYSSPDEEEVMRLVEERVQQRKLSEKKDRSKSHSPDVRSSSVSDFKELFGETKRSLTPSSDYRILSNSTSIESVFRSRSVSPATGTAVRLIKSHFEGGTMPKVAKPRMHAPQRHRSDPELHRPPIADNASKYSQAVRRHEAGDVSWITHKFETKNSASASRNSRSRCRQVRSPVQKIVYRGPADRLMPHIDIISKTMALKRDRTLTPSPVPVVVGVRAGDVQKMRQKFESAAARERMSMLGQMYTSSPDVSELRDISTYLAGDWVAHKYPLRSDNARSPVHPERGPIGCEARRIKTLVYRTGSASPPRIRSRIAPLLKPFYRRTSEWQDEEAKRTRVHADRRAEELWRKLLYGPTTTAGKQQLSVKFQDTEVNPPPPPPPKGVPLHANPNINGNGHAAASVANGHDQHDGPQQDDDPESPRRYVESDVNIHYKTPVRFEYKDAVPELELAQRQSEQMRKLYQEERRRKYLQELQDQSNRRHADYFTPSQKSPISLHRYDDFGAEVLASPTPPRIIARALYNFQGLTARELSFKKGDIIYIRREIDRNWFEGEHNAMIGLLPSNYVEIISRDGSRVPAARKPAEGQARAKFNFHAQSAIELSLNKGELVSLTRRVDDNWFEGRIANRKGIFPVSYVDVLTDIGSVDTPYIAVTAKVATATNNSAPLSIVPTHEYTASRGGITSSSSTTTINNIGSSDALLHNLNNNNNNSHNAINHNHQHAIQQQHQQQQLAKHNAGSGAYTSYASSSQKTAPAAGGAIVRETQTLQKTEVLHVDTASEPLAYRAIYTYRPQNSDELELHEGDTVYVLEKCDDGWFVGTSQRSGCFGTFPGNYVERI